MMEGIYNVSGNQKISVMQEFPQFSVIINGMGFQTDNHLKAHLYVLLYPVSDDSILLQRVFIDSSGCYVSVVVLVSCRWRERRQNSGWGDLFCQVGGGHRIAE
mmetsp:Transcript_14479/g.42421  ORF Transcript_14479/g.42421 Transcript_14479/m.42421 type:complete len:103 (-) Transcript_14479:436-744(-)